MTLFQKYKKKTIFYKKITFPSTHCIMVRTRRRTSEEIRAAAAARQQRLRARRPLDQVQAVRVIDRARHREARHREARHNTEHRQSESVWLKYR